MKFIRKSVVALLLLTSSIALAQDASAASPTSDKTAGTASNNSAGPEYVIGPQDVLHVAVWKETFSETTVHNSEARMPFVIGLAKIAALKQLNSKSSEETGRDSCCPHPNPRGCVG